MKKQSIIDALRAFTCQRPGFELGNYATYANYRQDYRKALRDRDIALRLLRDIELRDSISAEDIMREAQSGRLTLREVSGCTGLPPARVDYCTGQYWCVEYRAAVARLCASVLWTWKRDKCMPPDDNADKPLAVRYASVQGMSPGDYLRNSFRREYGKSIADRFFN